jgi:hypothetical protein
MDLTPQDKIIYDGLSEDEKSKLTYPIELDLKIWQQYLGRHLSQAEKNIIENANDEVKTNESMKKLHKRCSEKGLYVPFLSKPDGNCMFECLNYHNIGKDIASLRGGLASLMYILRDHENFVFKDNTIKSLFNCINDIEYVYRTVTINYQKKKIFHNYTYEVMCQDLSNMASWSKIPSEIILRIISYLYKVRIVIIAASKKNVDITIDSYDNLESKSESKSESDSKLNDNIKTIYLGQLEEWHYLPIDKLPEGLKDGLIEGLSVELSNELLKDMPEGFAKKLDYGRKAEMTFIKWAKNIEIIVKEKYITKLLRQQQLNITNNTSFIDPNLDSYNTYNSSYNSYNAQNTQNTYGRVDYCQ